MMKNKSLSFLLMSGFVVSAQMFVTEQVHAEIFKCINEQGAIFYNDKPCPVKDTETQIKAVKDPKNGYVPAFVVEKTEENSADGIIVGGGSSKVGNSKKDDNVKKEKADKKLARGGGGSSSNADNTSVSDNKGPLGGGSSSSDSELNSSMKQDFTEASVAGSNSVEPNTIEDIMHRKRMEQ